MSYSAYISFKTIEAVDIYPFFQKLKEEAKNKFSEIAKENVIFSPYAKTNAYWKEDFHKEYSSYKDKLFFDTADWGARIFSYRYFYLPEHKLLGIFGLPTCLCGLFDNTTYFQNSCDQDYEFETWNGIRIFEETANECKGCSVEKLREAYKDNDLFDEERWTNENEHEYIRKTLTYERIWAMFSEYLFNDKQVVRVSLFGPDELVPLCDFSRLVMEAYIEFHEKLEKEISRKNKTDTEVSR